MPYAQLQLEVPSLVQGIIDKGLLIGIFGNPQMSASLVEEYNIDAFFQNSFVVYPERPLRETI
jgi:hypothetical protein